MRASFLLPLAASVSWPALAQSTASPYTWATRYDLDHRVTGTIAPDPDGAGSLHYLAVRNSFDAQGRLVKIEKGELAAWQDETVAPSTWSGFTIYQTVDTAYDLDGRKLKETLSGPSGVQTLNQYNWDTLDRPVCATVRMNSATFASPPADACALGTEGSYGPDRVTKTLYTGSYPQPVKVQKAVGTALVQDYASFTYTSSNKLASMTDANGATAAMSYDALDRKARWYFPSKTTAGVASATDYEEYGYDANGNRTSWRKRDARVFAFAYDALNRMMAKIVPDGGAPASATKDVYYSYDLRGLQISARFDSASGTDAVVNTYDNLGRVASTTASMNGQPRTLAFQYDLDGNRAQQTWPDGAVHAYLIDGMDRTWVEYEPSTGQGRYLLYFDAQGRNWYRQLGITTLGTNYDEIGRVINRGPGFTTFANNVYFALAYSPASQIVQRVTSNNDFVYGGDVTSTRAYTVNGLNQYIAVAGAAFAYDANGNLTSDGNTAYAYDAENRLIGASGGKTATLIYDPLGRLYETSGSGGSNTTRFLYDGDNLAAEYNSAGTVLRRYLHGPEADEPLVWYEGADLTNPRWLHADERGSIVAVVDSTGDPIARNSYDEWGKPAAANLGRFQYTGQAWIPELGLYHYKARAYNPLLGRFMQTDPVGYEGGDYNLYAYVGNDPLDRIDPSGSCPEDFCVMEAYAAYRFVTAVIAIVNAAEAQRPPPPPRQLTRPPDLSSSAAPPPPDPNQDDKDRQREQRDKRDARRENESRGPDGNGQRRSGDGFRTEGRASANKPSAGEKPAARPAGPGRERNVGHPDGEEHSIKPKGQQRQN